MERLEIEILDRVAQQIQIREAEQSAYDQETYEIDCGPFHGRCPECGRHSAQDELCIDCEHILQQEANR